MGPRSVLSKSRSDSASVMIGNDDKDRRITSSVRSEVPCNDHSFGNSGRRVGIGRRRGVRVRTDKIRG
jgi:hypothetical protein